MKRIQEPRKALLMMACLMLLLPLSGCGKDPNLVLLDEVSSLVAEHHYDPDLNGLDWDAVTAEYRELVRASGTQKEALSHANAMLQELGDSHCAVGLISGAVRASSPYMFAAGSAGLDLRLIDGRAIITRVKEGSSADKSGLRAGFQVVALGGRSVVQIIAEATYRPPHTEANKNFHRTEALLWRLFGPAGSVVDVDYLDESHQRRSARLQRSQRMGGTEVVPSLPPAFIEVQESVYPGNIVRIAFNAFQPDEPDRVLSALDKLDQQTRLIIDLRGNNGGSAQATLQILGRFAQQRLLAYNRVNRHGATAVFVEPENPGPKRDFVVLVDEMSISAAENFAAIVQHAELASVIGVQTPGQLLWGEGFELGDGITMVVPTAEIIYPDGTNIEGVGVKPDLVVALDPHDLLQGVDTQLQAAINHLEQKS